MNAKITIHDIAQEMRVSIATVSRALNDKPGVSKQLKKNIRSYANHHGYVPNHNAVSMRCGKPSTAILIIRSNSVVASETLPPDAFRVISELGLEPHVVHIPYGEDLISELQRAEETYNPAIFISFGPCQVDDNSQFDVIKAPILFILSDDARRDTRKL